MKKNVKNEEKLHFQLSFTLLMEKNPEEMMPAYLNMRF